MPSRLALFDFDGTLADSFAWFASAFNELEAERPELIFASVDGLAAGILTPP